jgi:hypothetical protein
MYKKWSRKREFHESRLGGIRTLQRGSFSSRTFHIYWLIRINRVTEYLHSFLLISNEFHENRISEAHTLLEGANEPMSDFEVEQQTTPLR